MLTSCEVLRAWELTKDTVSSPKTRSWSPEPCMNLWWIADVFQPVVDRRRTEAGRQSDYVGYASYVDVL